MYYQKPFNIDSCKAWVNNPNINPLTNKKISIGGPTYFNIKNECIKLLGEDPFPEIQPKNNSNEFKRVHRARKKIVEERTLRDDDLCDFWISNPLINPLTGKNVKPESNIFKYLEKKCKGMGSIEKHLNNSNNFYSNTHILNRQPMKSDGDNISSPSSKNIRRSISWKEYCDNWEQSNVKFSQKDVNLHSINFRRYTHDVISKNLPSGFDKLINIFYLKNKFFEKEEEEEDDIYVLKIICEDIYLILFEYLLDGKDFFMAKNGNLLIIEIMEKFNELVLNNIIQNFPIVYTYTIYENQNLDYNPQIEYISQILCEKFDGTINQLIYNNISNELLENFLLQILLTIGFSQHILGLIHGNINSENIMWKKINPGGFWKYSYRGKNYYVENLGYVLYLKVHDNIIFADPNHSLLGKNNSREYGNRVLEIKQDSSGEEYTDIIKYKYHTEKSDDDKPLKKVPGFWISSSFVNSSFDIEADRTVFLDDLDTFPPYEFMYDIIDTIKIFSGGNYMNRKGNHIETNIERKEFLKKITNISKNIKTVLNSRKPYLFSCKKMLEMLFPNQKQPETIILNTFRID